MHVFFFTLSPDLYAQLALINKISPSERSRKFIKGFVVGWVPSLSFSLRLRRRGRHGDGGGWGQGEKEEDQDED